MPVAAHCILPALAVLFLIAAAQRWVRDGRRLKPASRTWLTVALIFGAVSLWLWWAATR